MLISNDWYPALARDNVELITDPIRRVTETGIVTADGVEREVDALIVAPASCRPSCRSPGKIKGKTGQTLSDAWAEHGIQAYKGATVAGFPNLFFLVGPNTGLGHSSMVYMIESQMAYLVDAVPHDAAAPAGHASSRCPRHSGTGTPTCSAGCSARSGAPAAARAGTSTSTAATSRCGRAPPTSSAS